MPPGPPGRTPSGGGPPAAIVVGPVSGGPLTTLYNGGGGGGRTGGAGGAVTRFASGEAGGAWRTFGKARWCSSGWRLCLLASAPSVRSPGERAENREATVLPTALMPLLNCWPTVVAGSDWPFAKPPER